MTRSRMADQPWVGEARAPFAGRQIGSKAEGGILVALGEDLERQLGPTWVRLDVAEFAAAMTIRTARPGEASC